MSDYQRTEYPADNCHGRVWINRDKQKPNANPRLPDKTGNIEIDGNPHRMSIWVNQDGSETMKARPMTPTEREKYFAKKAELKAKREAEANQHTQEIRQKIEPVKPKTPMPDPNIDDEIPF